MILVSFSSVEDALSNDVNKYDIFSSQGTENPLFHFFWDTRYNELSLTTSQNPTKDTKINSGKYS